MLYSYVPTDKGTKLTNSTDLAVRRIDHENGAITHDVIARMAGDDGNVYIRSLGTLSENAIRDAYRGDVTPRPPYKNGTTMYAWTNALALRPATIGKHNFIGEGEKEMQAILVVSGTCHHIELNRKFLRDMEGNYGGFAVIRLMLGDIVNVDGHWFGFEDALRKMLPPDKNTKMKDFSGEFNKGKILGPNISLV